MNKKSDQATDSLPHDSPNPTLISPEVGERDSRPVYALLSKEPVANVSQPAVYKFEMSTETEELVLAGIAILLSVLFALIVLL